MCIICNQYYSLRYGILCWTQLQKSNDVANTHDLRKLNRLGYEIKITINKEEIMTTQGVVRLAVMACSIS